MKADRMTQQMTQDERLRQASRARRQQQKEGLRRAILDAAGALFLQHGYEGFSLRQVAAHIGYSATTIYRYFENKDELLFALLSDGFLAFGRTLHAAAHSTRDPLQRIEALGRAYIAFGLQHPVHYQVMFMQRADFLFERRKGHDQPKIDSFNILQEAVKAAMDAGVMQRGDVDAYSHALWAAVHGLTSLAITGGAWVTPERVQHSTAVTLRMIIDGVRRR
jgi:AcrR family transcriptional regulator